MTPELLGISWQELLTLAGAVGVICAELRAIRRDIARLDAKHRDYSLPRVYISPSLTNILKGYQGPQVLVV